jgi:opacity protein-like surface antigen
LTLALRAGVGPTIPHAESVVSGVFQEQYELGAVGWQVASGVEARLTRGLLAVAEYKFTRTTQTVGVSGGEAETAIRTHHFAVGAGYRF